VTDIDVVFVGTPDTVTPIGIKGLGEIGVVGVSAAIAIACTTPPAEASGRSPRRAPPSSLR
jgi:hypothetical protein